MMLRQVPMVRFEKMTNCFQSNAKDMTHSSQLQAKVCMEFAFGEGEVRRKFPNTLFSNIN